MVLVSNVVCFEAPVIGRHVNTRFVTLSLRRRSRLGLAISADQQASRKRYAAGVYVLFLLSYDGTRDNARTLGVSMGLYSVKRSTKHQ